MKKLKKIMALALSFMMVVAMSVVAFADEGSSTTSGTYTITISNAKTGHIYEAYQIFAGTLSNDTLSDIKWGSGVTSDAQTNLGDASTKAATLKTADAAADFAKAVASCLDSSKATSSTENAGVYEISGLKAGYYLVKDKDNSLSSKEDCYTAYIMEVVKDVTATPKSSIPSFEKKIKDTNDTEGSITDWQDSADYDIGDSIPFQLKGTVADDFDKYTTYYFAFHDVEEKGLAFDKDTVVVKVDGNEITSGYSVVVGGSETGENAEKCTFEVKFDDLKTVSGVKAGSVITVEYKSVLTKEAVLGEYGNVNKAKLQFSNNPNDSQGGENGPTGETPWDNVIVFTYKVVVNKYANSVAENNKLAGAEFTLSKKLADGTTKDIAVVKSNEDTTFTFSGLDDGDYILTETKTPSGYNTIAPITFTVTASHNAKWTTGSRTDVLTSLSGDKATGDITFTADKAEGSLSADVINKSGSTLPTTGGMGTTIFYVVGSVLVLGAAVLLITKKRMSAR